MDHTKHTLFLSSLHGWYAAHGRHDLPWRNTTDPYAIYISEVMLQQTQVATVLDRYYQPFLAQFPTLTALANAPRDAVLKQWQGLGYYNRAANLHKAAQTTAPALPDSYDDLIALPGIGQNTAHAILAFAFHRPVPVLEANVKRIIYRIFALEEAKPAQLWELAATLLDPQRPFDYNQAMMDLGSMACTPKQPDCDACPANPICKGKNSPTAYPRPKAKSKTPIRKRRIIALSDSSKRFHLTARTSRFLHGLYGFIEQEHDRADYHFNGQNHLLNHSNHIGSITQTYSHFQLQAEVHLLALDYKPNRPDWYDRQQIESLPLSQADLKVVQLLSSQ